MAPNIVSNTSANKRELNKLYNEYLDEFREFQNTHSSKAEYNFPAPENPNRVTKYDIENAENALSNLREEKEKADDNPANDDSELIANIRQELQQGTNTSMCNLMEAILDTTIGNDYDGLIERLYGTEEYALDLTSTVAFDSNPGNILHAAERLAELITGTQQYNQVISDELQKWKKDNPKAHSTSSSRARDDDY